MDTNIIIESSAALNAALDATGANTDADWTRSKRIDTVASRYAIVIAEAISKISLSQSEWLAIMDALNGTVFDAHTYGMLEADIEDFDGLGEKWAINQDLLVQKLHGLSIAQKVAIAEVADRFWNRCDLTHVLSLESAGVRLTDGLNN